MPKLALLALLVVSPIPASAQALAQAQGEFPATLLCSSQGGGPSVRASLTVSLEGGRASYRVQGGGATETGTGTLSGVTLTLSGRGTLGGQAYTSRYTGDVSGRGGLLRGAQDGKGGHRACQMTLGDGRG